jgi:hypothetical protein
MPFSSSFSVPEQHVREETEAALLELDQLIDQIAILARWHLESQNDADSAYRWLRARDEVQLLRRRLMTLVSDENGLALEPERQT